MPAMQIRDLRCAECGQIEWDVSCEYDKYPACACGGDRSVTWEGGKAPTTDVYGCPQYSDASGEWHTSQREKVKHMKEWGWEEAGDKVGGARSDSTLKNSTFSFAGQTSRRTAAEGQ